MSMLPTPDKELAALENYIGSVAVDRDGEILAATSPHGNRIAFWNIHSGEFIGSRRMADVCGVAPAADAREFVVSSGNEGCAEFDSEWSRSFGIDRVVPDLQSAPGRLGQSPCGMDVLN